MKLERGILESTAANYPYLRGLLMVPIGMWFILTGAAQLLWESALPWVVGGAGLAATVAYLRIIRYYRDHYGKVTPPRSRQVKDALATVIGIVVLIATTTADTSLDLPINAYVASFALIMGFYLVITVGLRSHHVLIWGALLVAGLLPVWNGISLDNEIPMGLLPMGAATIATGILDHRALVRAFQSVAELNPGSGHVGA